MRTPTLTYWSHFNTWQLMVAHPVSRLSTRSVLSSKVFTYLLTSSVRMSRKLRNSGCYYPRGMKSDETSSTNYDWSCRS